MRLVSRQVLPLVLAGASMLAAREASAFCGFYVGGANAKLFNNATQVVVMREGTRTVLSMQNNYQGPPSGFAMVIPVPVVLQKENVKTLPRAVFDKIDQLAAPRLVEYWEQDPCYEPPKPGFLDRRRKSSMAETAPQPAPPPGALGVTVEAQFSVGEYEIVILSAKDAAGLDTWIKQEGYAIPDGGETWFRPYVAKGSKFFVAKVDPAKVKFENGMATLSPLRFHYDEETFTLPIRLGLMNAKDEQDLIVHVVAKKQRYEVANYPNAFIPTNLDVSENAKEEFGAFYAALFDRTLEKNPKAVVTEYAWATSSCDPCPGPALDPGDLRTLGMDVIPGPDCSTANKPGPNGYPTYRPECQPWGMAANFVVTRLHARYSKASVGEDLVFRAAEPVVGGREHNNVDGTPDHGVAKAPMNNFQGRYAIRHPWTGPITCKEPHRGVWGGPPRKKDDPWTAAPPPKAARDTAFAKRGAQLASFVRSNVPEIGFTVTESNAPAPTGHGESSAKSRCGCDVPGAAVPASAGWLAAGATVLLRLRRRRR